jgi:hypothetical protein
MALEIGSFFIDEHERPWRRLGRKNTLFTKVYSHKGNYHV